MTAGDLRIAAADRGPALSFRFDGRDIPAYEGESVAAALWAAGIRAWPQPPGTRPPSRTVFCAVGSCQQCVLWVDGVRVEGCRTLVRPGLDVRSAP